MRCFRHPERSAVGACRHCQRGLCGECAALVEDVLACRGHHEKQVAALMRTLATNSLQSSRVRSSYVRNGLFYGAVGLVFVGLGISQLRFLGIQAVFLVVVGALLLYASIANFLEAGHFQ